MALIKRVTTVPKFGFIQYQKLFLMFSAGLIIASLALFAIRGLNFGVDFRGGILLEVRTVEACDIGTLRSRLGGLGLGQVTLQEFGQPEDILINIERQQGAEEEQIAAIEIVKQALDDCVVEYRRSEFVGPKVGGELKLAGLLATVLSLIGIGAYILFRFEGWQFSVAALIALAHDIVATLGFYALTQIEFNLSTLAAVLTIAGYSINDTVVIFDRVRENLRKYKKMVLPELLDLSINMTLTRTVLTSFTTLLALGALFFFGGEVIRGFASGLIWGVLIGTYSSVGLAVPLLALLKLRRGQMSGAEQSATEDDKTPKGAKGKGSS